MPSFFRSHHFPLCLVLAAGAASPVWAVDPDESVAELAPESAPEGGADTANIAFNFKDAPFDQVLDFFSRESGLPIIRETQVPENAAMTFISAKKYTFEEALSILNLSLKMHGLHLRQEDNYLYLGTLEGSFTKPTPVMEGGIDDGTPPDRIVTVTLPLSNALAPLVAEQIKPLISQFGGIQAVPAQNMVIITETAGQVRRLSEIIRAIDSEKPIDSATELFPLKHSDPETVVNALKALIGERIKKVIVDKNGKQTVVEEETVPQVQLYPDPRTNTVLVTGAESRIETVRELIALLDVPEGAAGESQMMTFELATITAADAAKHLNALFGAIPEDRRPNVLPLVEVNKITVVASPSLLMQARALIGEVDPGSAQAAPGDARAPERVARTIRLEHVDARSIEQVVSRLMTPRQRQLVQFAATQDRMGLLVAGEPEDVDAFENLVRNIDVAPERQRDIRLMELSSADPEATVAKAESLFAQLERDDAEPLSISLDGRTLTLVGSPEQIGEFERMLRSAESLIKVTLETRRYDLSVREPSEIARQLPRIAMPMLERADGAPATTPQLDPIDELDTLIVRAEPGQFAVIEELIQRLDAAQPGDTDLRVTRVSRGDIVQIAARARELFDERTAHRDDIAPPEVRVEEDAGSLVITGSPEAIRLFDDAVRQAQQLLPPDRTTRIYDVQHLEASEIVAPLNQLMGSADSIDPSRKVPDPTVQVVERTNSLMVTAEPTQHQLIAQFITRLDSLEPTDLPPLKLLQLRTADAVAISQMLSQQYSKRPQADRSARPVEVRADAATNTLIVSAHPDLFEEIKAFVDDLNTERVEGPERITFLFTLKVAKAVDVAAAMDKLYPEPPMPRDRRNQPMPWLQKEKEVTVSADPSSNSLIIDAPADRRESLEELAEKLDRVEVPPIAQLRTYRIEKADLNAIASTLQNLSRNGNLSAPATSGGQPVRVVIETEPRSNTLIVAGDDVTFERVEQMLQDLSAVPIERGLRIVPIANADAALVRDRAMAIYDAQVAQIESAGAVDVTVNADTNSLEVVADDEAMQRFMDVLDELQRQAGPAREMRLIELRFASSETIVGFLEDLVASSASFRAGGGADPVFEAIEATNTLMVAAQPGQLPLIEQLVRNLDSEQQGEQPPIRILRLRSTDASNLASVLQGAYDRRPAEDKATRPVSIQADSATNTLIVSAHEEILPEIEQLITDLNEQQAYDDEGREIRIFPLKVARAEELAKTIDAMFPEPPMPYDPRSRQPRPDLRQPKEVVVRADTATNSIIVDAPAKRLAGFEQLVRSLDQHKLTDDLEVRTYRIERAELSAISRTLSELARTGALGATGQAQVTIETESMSRSLIVSGPTAIFSRVEAVLNDLDERPDMPATTMRLYPLAHARAERVQPLLERLLEQRLREDQERESGGVIDIQSLLEVAADGASNTLIIAAPEPIQQIAQQLIEALDVEAAQIGRSIIRVVPLTYASAADVSQTLIQAKPTIEWPSGGENLSIIPAAGSNALVLTGAQGDLKKLEELIEPLDRRPSDDEAPGVETFQLQHAEAGDIAQTVERLLGDQLASDPRILAAQIRYFRGQIPQRATVRVEADARTNSLIVSGPTASLELAKEIISRIDQPAGDADRTVLTFTPTKGEPDALIRTVSRIIEAKLPSERRTLELVHEARTGSIVAIGSPEQVAEAMKQLAEFDDRAIAMPALDLQLFDLAHADARAVAGTVQTMLGDRSRWPDTLRQAERAGLGVPAPRVNAEPDTNRLVISVPSALLPLAQGLIATLDTPASAGSTDLRVFRLSRGDAASVAQALTAALGADLKPGERAPVVTAETESNAVVIAATSERLDQAQALIEQMDAATDTSGVGVRTIFLENARAESIAPLVEQVLMRQSELDLLPEWQIASYLARRRPGEGVDQPVRVIAEPRLNAIVVSAPLAALQLAEDVVRELDVDRTPGPGSSRIVRVITPSNADAGELAQSLEAVLSEDDSGLQPPIIRVDSSSNTLIVRGSEEQLSRIESLVEQIDRATLATSREMRMIRVDPARVNAGVMAATLKQLLEQSSGVKVEVISVEDLLKEPGTEGSRSNRLDIRALEWVAPQHKSTLDAIRTMMLSTAIGTVVQPADDPADDPGGDESDDDPKDDGPGAPPGVTIAVDPATNSLVILGSTRLADRIAALVEQLQDQFPLAPTTVRVVNLPETIDPREVTALIRETIRQVGRSSIDNPGGFTGAVSITPDPTGSAVVVWANDADFQVVGKLIASVARSESATSLSVKVYPLSNIDANSAASAVTDLVSPSPTGRQARRIRDLDLTFEGQDGTVRATIDPASVAVTADPGGTSIIVSAPASSFQLIDAFVGLIDQSPVSAQKPIRTVKLEQADAAVVAQSLERFFQQRAQINQRSGRRAAPPVAIIGDRKSGTLVISASDEDFEQIESLISTFDEAAPSKALDIRIIRLENARVTDIEETIEDLEFELRWGGNFFFFRRGDEQQDTLITQVNQRTNSVVLIGNGERLESFERIVRALDVSEATQTQQVVRAVPVERADLQAVARLVEQSLATPGWRSWRGPDPDGVQIEIDRQQRLLFIMGARPRVDLAIEHINALDQAATGEGHVIQSIPLEFAQADRAARSLERFFRDRARAEGRPADEVAIIGSEDGNVLIISGPQESIETVQGLIDQIDQPELGDDRLIEVYTIKNAEVREVARAITQTFPSRRADERVIVTPQESTDTVIVSAPSSMGPEIEHLIALLDSPPSTDDVTFVSVPLEKARAADIVRTLQSSLPENLKIQITAVERSNSLLLTGSAETIELVRAQIETLDTAPPKIMQDFKRFEIAHARASEVYFPLIQLLRNRSMGPNEPAPSLDYLIDENVIVVSATPEQMADIEKIIAQLDTPSDVNRTTEFVKLRFAEAETVRRALEIFYGRFARESAGAEDRNVTIVTDTATNSLVISASESSWEGIRALLAKLDTEAYDTSRQIEVIPLAHADAASVAKALNEGFGSQVRRQLEAERAREGGTRNNRSGGENGEREQPPPMSDVIVSGDDQTPTVSAEAISNSLIVFADRDDLVRIRAIVEQLDLPDVLRLPPPRVIPLQGGRASELANAVRKAFSNLTPREGSRRGVLIFGDDASNTIIVRADDEPFEQIAALIETLQGHVDTSRLSSRVLRVSSMPAARLRETVLRTFRPVAQQAGEQLTVEVERQSNALVIASSERIFNEIESLVEDLDAGFEGVGGANALGQSVLIIDVKHNTPEQVQQMLNQLGVTRPPPQDRPGIVSEPITIVPMRTRSSLAIVASPADAQTITALVRALDAEPTESTQHVEVVPLRLADASAVVQTMESLLSTEQRGGAAPADALAEHIRRLSIAHPDWNKGKLEIDLSLPIKLTPDPQTNAVAIASSEANVKALTDVVKMLDTLPIGDAVVVRIFPMENASAARVRAIVEQLFRQGEALRRLPGTQRQGLPPTVTGQALAGEISATVDDRTNALIVAGREEAVAFVETLIAQLDSDEIASWVEPVIIPLDHADPVKLARTLSDVLVRGLQTAPEALGIQQQIARLRVVREGGDPAGVEADLFAPMTGLVITAEEQLGSLIVVGSTSNLQVVKELVSMLDVEAAGAGNEIRVYPLEHAAADRVSQTLRGIFQERERAGTIRPEDRLIVSSDIRTNTLIVSTSPRSIEILESLLTTLDSEEAKESVGVHVLHVPGTDVRQLATIIESLMRERIDAVRRSGVPQSPSDAFSVEASPATSSLIIASSDENLEVVKELIATLTSDEVTDRGDLSTELINVGKGQAGDIADAINELYVERENERRGERAVNVVPNERLNVLIVTGTADDIAQIRALVDSLSQAEVTTEQDMRRIELSTANALEVVNLLQQVLAGRAIGGGRTIGGQATKINFYRYKLEVGLRQLEPGQMGDPMGDEVKTVAEIDDALRQQIRLTPDLRTNSVVIVAPPQIMNLIVEIIEDLDTTTAGNRNIEMFRLTNADAFAMAEVLSDLFNLRQDGNAFVLIPSPLVGPDPLSDDPDALDLFGGQTVTPVPDERQELSITIDPRTNTLLVSGTAEYLELVRSVVTELDTIEATERERLVYHLRNAKADEVEETLRDYFQTEADRIRQTLRPEQMGSLARLLEQEVTIVGDIKSNKLVVSASPRYIETIRGIIEELDAAPPQVVIQVLLAEVTIDRSNTWGMDLRVGPLGGDMYIFNSTPAGGAVSTALGLPTLSVASDDFGLLVRALEEQGRLEVLSRPSVTVNNNERAQINVGDDVGIVDGVTTFTDGNTQPILRREEVGVSIEVTPTISADGFVRLEIIPEISNVSNRTTQVSAGLETPIIARRRVDTVVTIMDGQTIVIGGLIQNSTEDRKTKVPILGHIPIIGKAFQTDQFNDVRTELLIILTPKVIRGAGDTQVQRALSERAINQISAEEGIRRMLSDGISEDLKRSTNQMPEAKPNDGSDQDEPEGLLVKPASLDTDPPLE